MAVQILTRAENMRLVPTTAGDQEMIAGLPGHKTFLAKLTSASVRSVQQNKFYWALLGKVVENSEHYTSSTGLHFFLKVRLGYVEEIQFHDGRMVMRVASTSFERMDDLDFKPYLDGAISVIVTEIIPGLPRNRLISEIEAMLGISYDSLWRERRAA